MKITIVKQGRTFECYPSAECSGKMCAVNIYEVVRPTWKIFRTKYRSNKVFWVDDYDTLQEGIDKMLDYFLEWEREEAERITKWGALEKFGNSH